MSSYLRAISNPSRAPFLQELESGFSELISLDLLLVTNNLFAVESTTTTF